MTQESEDIMNNTMTVAYHDHQRGLNKHSFFKMHNRQLSEDLVQDTYMKTLNYLIKGGKIDVMKAFLYHILNCLIIDEYRKRKTVSLDNLLENGFTLDTGNNERMVDMLDGKTALILIARLPEKYQKVMRMRYTQDLSLGEMSLITGQTKNSMAVQLHRGLEKLKVLYGHA
jgi:RNA polymerase sigma-70 factor (ECF subfamily)